MVYVYKQIKNHFIQTHEEQQKRDGQLQEALEAVRKYPEYRQQSVNIQKKLENDISALKDSQEKILQRLLLIEETNKRRERNKIRDTLLRSYRHYTNPQSNPSQTWTRMEADAFWELFKEYEEADGDGYMHTDVQPAMNLLTIIEMEKH